MPITKSAKKKIRQDKKKRKVNVLVLKKVREEIKKYVKKPSAKGASKVASLLDIALKKNLFHANKVARMKSKFSKLIAGKSTSKTTKSSTKK